ncbi:MAG: F0F1 ATP synthase subunit A [Clostridia bacterium]|nr:F0F1 ATP synthase subunit A [Clostridia bacterium]
MNRVDCKSLRFKIVDILYILMMIVPIVTAIVLRVLFTPVGEGVTVTGPLIYLEIPFPLQDIVIAESQINSWLVIITILGLCLFMTHGLQERAQLKRQHIAEILVEKADALINDNMGQYFSSFAPFIMAIMAISAFSSLMSLFGLFPPTSDMNVVAGWSILVFGIITYYKLKCGPLNYLKEFTKPVAVLTPINIISEFATPISMAFRHYGNVLSGIVVSVLLGSALQGLSRMVLSFAPEAIASIPIFQVGIPAVLSVYFDVFSGLLQAFIFAMLTMLYVSGAFDLESFLEYRRKKAERKKNKTKNN